MIVYELRCSDGHGFEAWFRNSEAYDQQHAAHQIACPICGIDDVSKAPMAPRIAKSRQAVPVKNADRKSTRLNSSHVEISYAVFCLKKKKKKTNPSQLKKKKKTKKKQK